MNCMKNSQEKVDLYIKEHLDKEFDRIQQYDYLDLLNIPNETACTKEWLSLVTTDKHWTHSNMVRRFHLSLCLANRNRSVCPYEGWEIIKKDKTLFEKLLRNRATYNDTFIKHGLPEEMPLHIYKQGMVVMKMFPEVSYFKPSLAKHLVQTYLNDCHSIIDPFSGYSGRMLGVLACNKNYYGSDLCEPSVSESYNIYEWLKSIYNDIPECYLDVADAEKVNSNDFDALFTCPPYEDIEQWPGVDADIHNCDDWIDICIANNKCNKYLFVVDDKIDKWKNNVVETIENKSHFGSNMEYVVLIE